MTKHELMKTIARQAYVDLIEVKSKDSKWLADRISTAYYLATQKKLFDTKPGRKPSKWQAVFGEGLNNASVYTNLLKNGTRRIKLYGSNMEATVMWNCLTEAGYEVVKINVNDDSYCRAPSITAYVKA